MLSRTRVTAVAGLFISRASGTAMQSLSQLLIGRYLGAAALGTLGMAQGNVLLFGTLGSFGAPQYVLSKTAKVRNDVVYEGTKEILIFSLYFSLLSSVVICALMLIGANLVWKSSDFEAGRFIVVFVCAGSIFYSISKVIFEYMKGINRGSKSLSLEYTMPYILTVASLPISFLVGDTQLSVQIPGIAFCISFGITFFIALRIVGLRLRDLTYMENFFGRCRAVIWEMVGFVGVQVGNQIMFSVPVAVIFLTGGAAAAGIMVVALKLTGLTSTISAILTAHFAPQVVVAYRDRDRHALESLFKGSVLQNGITCGALSLALLCFPKFFLNLFGSDFGGQSAAHALQIMAIGRLIRQFAGLTEVFLGMTGRAVDDILSQAISLAFFFVALSALFVTKNIDNIIYLAVIISISTTMRPILSLYYVSKMIRSI